MFRFVFLFLLDFSGLFLCEGAVFGPSNRTNLIFMPGSTEKLEWSFTDDISGIVARIWTFTPSGGPSLVRLAIIIGDRDVEILTTSYEVAVEKPATLVLKNVNLTYNGTYQFSLSPGASRSDVVVYIAVKPTATACSSSITVNKGQNVSCACQGQGGNPPAKVTWYKDSRKIGETGKEEKTLTLTNVTLEKDDGKYKCVAQSFPNKMFQDEVQVKVIVTLKPKVMACCSPIIVNEGDNVSCTCLGEGGNPPADVTWYKDNRKIGGTGKEEKPLTLTNVIHEKDHGSYRCVAQSYPNEMFQDEVEVEVIVNCKPNKTNIQVPEEAYVGERLVINCYSKGYPSPNFTITHKVSTNIVSNHSRYVKDIVDHSDAGLYECIVKNFLGNDTDSDKLIVKELHEKLI